MIFYPKGNKGTNITEVKTQLSEIELSHLFKDSKFRSYKSGIQYNSIKRIAPKEIL